MPAGPGPRVCMRRVHIQSADAGGGTADSEGSQHQYQQLRYSREHR